MTPAQISPAGRVRRLAHRLGIILAVPLAIAALWNFWEAGWVWRSPPTVATTYEQLDFYSVQPPRLIGDNLVYRDGSNEPFQSALSRQTETNRIKYEARLNSTIGLAGILSVAAVLTYIISIAIGWAVSGAFRD